MADADPLVSVVIPTYNREAYLREAVASVVAQAYTNWELIVADDGSTDGTRAYLASLSDPRVRVVTLEHSGNPAKVRNVALTHANGQYVAFLDDDDLWMPQKLAVQIADLRAKPDCRWSYTSFIRIGPSGREIGPSRSRSDEGWIIATLVSGQRMATPSVLAERKLVTEIGGFDEALVSSEDFDAFLRMALASQVASVPVALCAVRDHPGNTWKDTSLGKIILNQVRVYEKLLAHALPAEVRVACEYGRANWEIQHAHWLRARHSYGRSLGAFVRALYRGRTLSAVWLAKASLRPLLPESVLRRYRAIRGAGQEPADFENALAQIPRDIPARFSADLPVLGVPVRFETNDAEALALVEEAFGSWRSLACSPELIAPPGARVRIIVRDGEEGAVRTPASYRQLDGDRHILRTRGSVGIVDGPGREAEACVTRALFADRMHTQYVWIEAMTLTLVSARNRFPVHAAAIARGDSALLLAGPPGTGKSTLAYQASRSGIRVLSDDAVYVQVEPELRIWGTPGHVHLVAAARAHFAELADRVPTLRANGDEKIVVDLPGDDAPPIAARAGVCLLERGAGGGPARLSRVGAEEVRLFLKDGLGVSRFRFGKDLDRALQALVPSGGWRLRLSAHPADAAPLLEEVLGEVELGA